MRISKAFEALSLPTTATPDTVRTRWRELATQHHPDKGGNLEDFKWYQLAFHKAYEASKQTAAYCEKCSGSGAIRQGRGFNTVQLPCDACVDRDKY